MTWDHREHVKKCTPNDRDTPIRTFKFQPVPELNGIDKALVVTKTHSLLSHIFCISLRSVSTQYFYRRIYFFRSLYGCEHAYMGISNPNGNQWTCSQPSIRSCDKNSKGKLTFNHLKHSIRYTRHLKQKVKLEYKTKEKELWFCGLDWWKCEKML